MAISPVSAQQDGSLAPITISQFGGLDDTNPSATLPDSQAQSALNVEASLTGNAIMKRSGYSRTASLSIATSPVSGSFSFVDVNGNYQTIVCQDHNCSKSTNGGAFTVFHSTAGGSCMPTRWSWAQISGTAYGANSCRDPITIWSGGAITSSATIPQGAVLELTKDRMVIADVASNPNGVYYSMQGTPTNFVTGVNSVDPYVDSIGSPGDRVTALKNSLTRLFIFKTTSITGCNLKDQYSSTCYPVSNSIGTNDPNSIVEIPGAIMFRGNDGNYWSIDDNGNLEIASKMISNLVKSQTSGTVQSNTQTSQGDWQAGTQTTTGTWNTVTTPGAIFPSSTSVVDASSASYVLGTLVNISTAINGSLFLTQAGSATFTNAGSESNSTSLNLASNSNWISIASNTIGNSFPAGQPAFYGSRIWESGTADNSCSASVTVYILDTSSNVIQSVTKQIGSPDQNSAGTYTIALSTFPYSMVKYRVTYRPGGSPISDMYSVPFIRPSSFTFTVSGNGSAGNCQALFDTDEGTYTTSGYYTSQRFDVGYSTPIWGPFAVTLSSTATNPVTFKSQVSSSASGGNLDAAVTATPGNAIASGQKRFIVYTATFTANSSTNTASILSGASIQAATTGQYTSQCIAPGSNVSAWGILSCAETTTGNASLQLAVSTGTSCTYISTSAFTNMNNNAAISIATAAAVNIRFTSLLTSSTEQAQVDACTLYWNNGVIAPPTWGAYDTNKNSIYWTTAINNSATNNRVLKYDLNLNQWFPFDLQANAINRILNVVYFGDSTAGFWNQYDGVNSDNGSAINSYWKSKDFSGSIPFQDKSFNTISMVTKNQGAGTMNVTYTTSDNVSTTYSVSLATTTGATYVHANKLLASGSVFQFMNIQIGNNSTTPWEVDGLQSEFTDLPWKDQNP